MGYISVDVDIDEVLWNMRDKEKQQLVDDLYEDGFIPKELNGKLDPPTHAAESFFNDALAKLRDKWNMLSEDEEQTIIKIANRF